MVGKVFGAVALCMLSACGGAAPPASPHAHEHGHEQAHEHGAGHGQGHDHGSAATTAGDPTEQALDAVAVIHGAPGPWAVAGYRMGEYALAKLGLSRGSFDLEVIHHTPRAVKYSCIADGAAASTGASAGKLNLVLVDADEAHVATTFRRKSTGQAITLRFVPSFAARFADVPPGQARTLGREVLLLPASSVFEEIPTPAQ
jgi:hypothetical protein